VQLASGVLSYRLVRARRRTIGLWVEAEGVQVRAPRHATLADIEGFIREKDHWIRKAPRCSAAGPFCLADRGKAAVARTDRDV